MKNIIQLTICILILFGTFSPISLNAKPSTIDRFSIEGVHINTTESQVYRRLGKPIRHKKSTSVCAGNIKELTFLEGTVTLAQSDSKGFTVIAVNAKSRNWKTEAGVRVGDSISQAKKYYKFNADEGGIVDGSDDIALSLRVNKAKKIVNIGLTLAIC
jgi:hypothetical protein